MSFDLAADKKARRQARWQKLTGGLRARKARKQAEMRTGCWSLWVEQPDTSRLRRRVKRRWPVSSQPVLEAVDGASVAQQVEALDRLAQVVARVDRRSPYRNLSSVVVVVGAVVGAWVASRVEVPGWLAQGLLPGGVVLTMLWATVGIWAGLLLLTLADQVWWSLRVGDTAGLEWVVAATEDETLELTEQEQALIADGGEGSR